MPQLAKGTREAAGLTLVLPAIHLPCTAGLLFGILRESYELGRGCAPTVTVADVRDCAARVP